MRIVYSTESKYKFDPELETKNGCIWLGSFTYCAYKPELEPINQELLGLKEVVF